MATSVACEKQFLALIIFIWQPFFNSLVKEYYVQKRYDEAIPLITRSLKIHSQSLGLLRLYGAKSLNYQAENAL